MNLKGATDDVLNGDYQLYSTTSCTYAVFKHGSRMLYLFRSGDYWMVDSYYHCDIVNDTYAYLKVDDPVPHPDHIENPWKEKNKYDNWVTNYDVDVDCPGM